jgi:cob(I)alamin adenosyltransferase
MANENDEHRERMEQRRQGVERRKAAATLEKGLILVHTGNGKGKTTAALGLALRALGQGFKVGIVQFIKGAIATGEAALIDKLKTLAPIEIYTMGEGFTWNTQDRERDIQKTREAWDRAVSLLRDATFNLVILDEINVVISYDYLPLEEVLSELRHKRPELHVVLTGRGARPEIIELADLVTEMKLVKHPYREQGVKAQKGIEF